VRCFDIAGTSQDGFYNTSIADKHQSSRFLFSTLNYRLLATAKKTLNERRGLYFHLTGETSDDIKVQVDGTCTSGVVFNKHLYQGMPFGVYARPVLPRVIGSKFPAVSQAANHET